MIVKATDFIGEYKVPKTLYSEIDQFIEDYEKSFLQRMLGVELYNLFVADLVDGVPQNQIYLNIFEPLAYDLNNIVYQSEGIKRMLVELIYYYYTVSVQTYNTDTGTMSTESEVSTKASYKNNIIVAYNKAVANAHVIQQYIFDNKEDYPTQNLQKIEYISGI